MTAFTVTSCAGVDRASLHRLWASEMPGESLTVERFDDLVAHAGLGGARLLRRDDEPVGFIHTATRPHDGIRRGWILGFGVRPELRRQGLGRALVADGLALLDAQGAVSVAIGGPGEHYLVPGIDPVAYPGAAELLTTSGFRPAGATFGMESGLDDVPVRPSPPVGTEVRVAQPDERDHLLSLIRRHFSVGWAEQVASSGPDDRVLVAVADGQLVGFGGYDLFPGCPGRFGPTGVATGARGRGIGAALLTHCMDRMRDRGHRRAWFLWGPDGTAGQAMYRSAGFVVSRRFHFYTRTLAADESE